MEEDVVEGVDWWPLLALFLAALLASVTSALTAFGLAIIFHVVLQALFIFGLLQVELTDVVVYILMMGPFTLWPIFILYWKEIDWRLFGLIFPPKVLLTLAGTYLLVSFDSSTLKKILGAILLVFSIWKCYVEFKGPLGAFFTSIRERGLQQDRTRSDFSNLGEDAATNLGDSSNLADWDEELDLKKPLLESVAVDDCEEELTTPKRPPFSYPMIALIVACAIGSGLMGGMFGVSGPPLMIIITFAPLEKGPLRSTFIGIFALTNIPQSYFLYREGLFSWDAAPSYAAVATGGLLGTVVGNALYKYMSTQMLMRGILFLLICSCLTLLDLPNWALITFCAAFVIGTIGFFAANALLVSHNRNGETPSSPSLSPPAPPPATPRKTTTYSTIS